MNPARNRLNFTLRSESLQDHVAKHVRLGFRLADLADVDKLLHERLVFRCESYMVLTNHVAATVSDLNEVQTVAPDRSAGERCAHAGATRVFLAPEMNGGIGVMRGVLQTVHEIDIGIAGGIAL